ncbi:MAG: hypothetical protein CM15mP77_2800 [Synechococcus sp.]|nr:MAG: hypothetical protein CM15mP77_2800 [Synechococcus sp.]
MKGGVRLSRKTAWTPVSVSTGCLSAPESLLGNVVLTLGWEEPARLMTERQPKASAVPLLIQKVPPRTGPPWH